MAYHPKQKLSGRARRKVRVRKKVSGSVTRPRLSVFRSAKHIYAQVISDETGRTLASASTLSATLKQEGKKSSANNWSCRNKASCGRLSARAFWSRKNAAPSVSS